MKGSPESQCKKQNRCRLIIYPHCCGLYSGVSPEPAQPLTWWPPRLGGEGLMPSNRGTGGRFWTAGDRELKQCDLWAAQFHNEQVYMESHHALSSMGWGGSQGGYSWVHGTAGHPSTANIKSSVNIYNLPFLITQSWKNFLGREKTDRQAAPFSGKSQNTSGDTVSPNRLQSTGQLLTFLQAGKNVCLDVQTLDSSLTSLSAKRALTGK